MNGAESLARTLVACGVEVCFANPGTSEMHFVAALDRVEGIRCVLGLFEGVVTGAADGYGRMADKPAATLLHLGPGLGNGLANLHNANKAMTPLVNIVGDHATYHLRHDAPLTADIEGIAGPVSQWLRTSSDARSVAADGAEAIAAALTPPGRVATLILPADTAWTAADGPAVLPAVAPRAAVNRYIAAFVWRGNMSRLPPTRAIARPIAAGDKRRQGRKCGKSPWDRRNFAANAGELPEITPVAHRFTAFGIVCRGFMRVIS